MGHQPEHFLKRAKARDLSAVEVARLSEAQAYDVLFRLRWSDGVPVCPTCGLRGAWTINTTQKRADGRIEPRRLLKCKSPTSGGGKRHQFTVTSGTRFHSHKRSLRDVLFQVFQFTRGAKGYAALSQVFQTGSDFKSVFVFQQKLRRAIRETLRDSAELQEGVVEADLVFIGGYNKPNNSSGSRLDRRNPANRSRKKQGVLTLRERGRSGRCWTFLTRNETTASLLVLRHVREDTQLHIDASKGWVGLDAHFDVRVINHSEAFARIDYDGVVVSTNQAESFHSRLRRAEIGIHHHIAGPYALDYSEEMAWREMYRRKTAKEQFEMLLTACLTTKPDRRWQARRYWGAKPWERDARS